MRKVAPGQGQPSHPRKGYERRDRSPQDAGQDGETNSAGPVKLTVQVIARPTVPGSPILHATPGVDRLDSTCEPADSMPVVPPIPTGAVPRKVRWGPMHS